FLNGGVPSAKLMLGLPFYGRGWKEVPPGPNNDGLYQAASGSPGGGGDYRNLKNLEATYSTHRSSETGTFWIYNPSAKIFWSYDDPESMANKMRYVVEKKLGGA